MNKNAIYLASIPLTYQTPDKRNQLMPCGVKQARVICSAIIENQEAICAKIRFSSRDGDCDQFAEFGASHAGRIIAPDLPSIYCAKSQEVIDVIKDAQSTPGGIIILTRKHFITLVEQISGNPLSTRAKNYFNDGVRLVGFSSDGVVNDLSQKIPQFPVC